MKKYIVDKETGEKVLIHVGGSGSGSKTVSIAPYLIHQTSNPFGVGSLYTYHKEGNFICPSLYLSKTPSDIVKNIVASLDFSGSKVFCIEWIKNNV